MSNGRKFVYRVYDQEGNKLFKDYNNLGHLRTKLVFLSKRITDPSVMDRWTVKQFETLPTGLEFPCTKDPSASKKRAEKLKEIEEL